MVNFEFLAVGLLLLAVGALLYRYAYHIAFFGEVLDAIGSTRPTSEVEPAGWNVRFTKYTGTLIVLVGGYFTIGSLLGW